MPPATVRRAYGVSYDHHGKPVVHRLVSNWSTDGLLTAFCGARCGRPTVEEIEDAPTCSYCARIDN